MLQKMLNLKRYDNLDFFRKILPLLIVLFSYALLIHIEYGALPIRPDELWYVLNVEYPEKSSKLFFRFYNFYIAKLISSLFVTSISGAAFTSFLYALGVISITYTLILKLSNQTSATLGAIIVATYPTLVYQSTWYGSDLACLFFGLLAVYFSVNIYLDKNCSVWNAFGSGFFLIGAIYSKQSGICFILPIALLLLASDWKKVCIANLCGVLGGFVFLSVCNAVWLGDFYYHINPHSYFEFLNRFDGQISSDIISKRKWSPTFIKQIIDSTPWVLVYIVATVLLFSLNGIRERKDTYIAFCVFMVGVSSFVIHESVHVGFVALNIHFRYMLTMIVPVLIAFSILLPINVDRNNSEIVNVFRFNVALSLFFLVVLFATRNQDYYQSLEKTWSLYNSLINVFSFWFFLFGFCLLFYRSNEQIENRSVKLRLLLQIIGGVILVIYSSLWANIQGSYQTWRMVKGDISKFERLKKDHNIAKEKLLVINLKPSRKAERYIQYSYVNNVIERPAYLDIIKREFSANKKEASLMDELIEGDYVLVWTGSDVNQLNDTSKKIKLKKKYSFSGNTLYEVIYIR